MLKSYLHTYPSIFGFEFAEVSRFLTILDKIVIEYLQSRVNSRTRIEILLPAHKLQYHKLSAPY